MSQLRSKQSAKAPSPENSLATGSCFECNIYHITALGWLKKERKKTNNSDFRLFQVCHFKIVTIHIAITTAYWSRHYNLLYVVLDASISSLAILKSGHPYIWAMLPWAHNDTSLHKKISKNYYLCRDGCWIMWPSLCGIPALSASAFIDSSLHQLDFFLGIFLWRLVSVDNA